MEFQMRDLGGVEDECRDAGLGLKFQFELWLFNTDSL